MRDLVLSALLLALGAAPALAEPYRLHAQDRLLVRVVAWDPDTNGLAEWAGVSGEYLLASDGTLQFPLAGTLAAEGQTMTALQEQLATALGRNAGLDRPPHVTVELVESLPVYILGAAQSQGAVAFRPGLTARQALALAGGVYRNLSSADPMLMARIAGDARLAAEELRQHGAERAAIEAELAELESPEPQQDTDLPADADLRSRLQAADRVARNAQAASLDSLQQLLRDKADKLRQQIVLRDQQLADNRRDLEGIAELKEKGLAVNARVTALTTAINDMEAKRLDLEATLLMAEQQLNEAERDRAAIIDDARSATLQKLAELEDEMAAPASRRGTADRLLTQAMLAGELAPEPGAAEQPVFVVTRITDGTPERIEATPDMALEPGDVLEIALPGAADASARPVAAAPPPAAVGQVAAASPALAAR